jgi:hypothetical protein
MLTFIKSSRISGTLSDLELLDTRKKFSYVENSTWSRMALYLENFQVDEDLVWFAFYLKT